MIYVPKKCVMGGLMPTDEGFMREVGVELKFDIHSNSPDLSMSEKEDEGILDY